MSRTTLCARCADASQVVNLEPVPPGPAPLCFWCGSVPAFVVIDL